MHADCRWVYMVFVCFLRRDAARQFQSGLKTHLFKRAYIWLLPPRTIEEWTYLLTYLSAVCAVVRCLSVRLSVTFVYCIQMSEDIGKLLSMPGSPIILVFLTHAPIPNSKSFRGHKMHGVPGKILRFSTEIDRCLSKKKRHEIGHWLLWIVNRKS